MDKDRNLENEINSSLEENNKWEKERIEYEQAFEMFRYLSGLRRQSLAFVTVVQGAIITIIRDQLHDLDTFGIFMSILAFIVVIIGQNNERRIARYMKGFMERVRTIEKVNNMFLLGLGYRKAHSGFGILRNTLTFPIYYLLLASGWIVIWIL